MATAKQVSPKKRPVATATELAAPNRDARTIEVTAAQVDAASTVYVDSLIHLGVGPFVSKCTFGIQKPGTGTVDAPITLTMPTNSLVDLATNIIKILAGEGQSEQFGKAYSVLQGQLANLQKP